MNDRIKEQILQTCSFIKENNSYMPANQNGESSVGLL